jgi:predicted RNA-binding Zn-ribbon protein involved in translation (DUF1610 family)
MSHYYDEQYSIYDETTRLARKEHVCSACQEPIRVGDKYVRVFILHDGGKEHLKRCARCQKIHAHLRGLDDDMWPDERLNCGEEYENHWGEKPPDDIAALAFALPGETKL